LLVIEGGGSWFAEWFSVVFWGGWSGRGLTVRADRGVAEGMDSELCRSGPVLFSLAPISPGGIEVPLVVPSFCSPVFSNSARTRTLEVELLFSSRRKSRQNPFQIEVSRNSHH
jgi:hypothetical protein